MKFIDKITLRLPVGYHLTLLHTLITTTELAVPKNKQNFSNQSRTTQTGQQNNQSCPNIKQKQKQQHNRTKTKTRTSKNNEKKVCANQTQVQLHT